MSTSKQSRTGGITLILVGIALLTAQLTGLHWWKFWPLILILGGISFIAMFLRDKKTYGVLMPASVLIVVGSILCAGTWFGWEIVDTIWPLFIAAPGIGFFAMYFFGSHEPGLLVPACILTGLAAYFLLALSDMGEYWPALLIIVGIALIVGRRSPAATQQ